MIAGVIKTITSKANERSCQDKPLTCQEKKMRGNSIRNLVSHDLVNATWQVMALKMACNVVSKGCTEWCNCGRDDNECMYSELEQSRESLRLLPKRCKNTHKQKKNTQEGSGADQPETSRPRSPRPKLFAIKTCGGFPSLEGATNGTPRESFQSRAPGNGNARNSADDR